MNFQSITDWFAWAGVVLPLVALAGSVTVFVVNWAVQLRHKEYSRLFEVMAFLDDTNSPLAKKMAAAYQLRQFKRHADFIVRFCESVKFEGPATPVIAGELARTAEFLKAQK